MRITNTICSLTLLFSTLSLALELPESHILHGAKRKLQDRKAPSRVHKHKRTTTSLTGDSHCTNAPKTRSCWLPGYDVATDFDLSWPTTGKTVSYDWTITNTTCNPDGAVPRTCLLINGQYPGPTLKANWGDMISVTVHNNMQYNGTGIHWHGVRQYKTNIMDGTGGITECPIAPGTSKTYTFQATQFGTSWYHSHFASQYGDGVVGPIQINGPSSLNYDQDLGPVVVTDWYYQGAYVANDQWDASLQKAAPGPPGNTILINGKNKTPNGTGSYWTTQVKKGRKYKLRLINTSVNDAIRVSIDNHQLEVISSDFVPIKPITASSVLLGIGQRYDVVFTANQKAGNYWIQANAEGACETGNMYFGRGIINYSGVSEAPPSYAPVHQVSNGCNPPGTLTPWVPNTVDETEFTNQVQQLGVNLVLPGMATNQENIVLWGINSSSMDIQWQTPTLSYVMSGNTNYPAVSNLIEIPNEGTWSYWILQEVAGGPVNISHPIHLHGHDFYVLGFGNGQFNTASDSAQLTYDNPTRRDTALLPAGGWLIIAFPADNPGAWLMHCHMSWHISEGLGVQFLEAKSQIPMPDNSQYNSECSSWSKYAQNMPYPKGGSGLRRHRR